MRPGESFVGQPIRSLQTMLRVLGESDRKYQRLIPDGIYGPQTIAAVTAFQRNHGLPVTGITDQDTWDTIVAVYEPALIRVDTPVPIEVHMNPGQVYRRGDISPNIYLLQSMLTQLSKDHTMIPAPGHTGILDASTAESLSGFQNLSNLPTTGELDKITWKHLVHQFSLNAHHEEANNLH